MNLLFRVIYAAHAKGTHHKLALDGLAHLDGLHVESWRRLFLKHADVFMLGAKAPDDEFKDFVNHVLHPRDGFWGGAPAKARSWYGHVVTALRQRDWSTAAYAAGVLSHYVTDPIHPFHTAQSEAENAIHRATEWSINRAYDSLRAEALAHAPPPDFAMPDGDNWLEVLLCDGAALANMQYERLIAHYDIHRGVVDPPTGLDPVARRIVGELLLVAAALFGRILQRAIDEADVVPPEVTLTLDTILATVKVPLAMWKKRLADAEDRRQVEAMYDELQATGRVVHNLPADDKAVAEAHAREVLARKTAAEPVKLFLGPAQPVETAVERSQRLKREAAEKAKAAAVAKVAERSAERKGATVAGAPATLAPSPLRAAEPAVPVSGPVAARGPAPSPAPAPGLAPAPALAAAPAPTPAPVLAPAPAPAPSPALAPALAPVTATPPANATATVSAPQPPTVARAATPPSQPGFSGLIARLRSNSPGTHGAPATGGDPRPSTPSPTPALPPQPELPGPSLRTGDQRLGPASNTGIAAPLPPKPAKSEPAAALPAERVVDRGGQPAVAATVGAVPSISKPSASSAPADRRTPTPSMGPATPSLAVAPPSPPSGSPAEKLAAASAPATNTNTSEQPPARVEANVVATRSEANVPSSDTSRTTSLSDPKPKGDNRQDPAQRDALETGPAVHTLVPSASRPEPRGQNPRRYLERAQQVADAPSIGPSTAERLRSARIRTVGDLLDADPEAVAKKLNARHITAATVRDWQAQAQLVIDVPGLRGTHAQLLVGAGLRTRKEVAETPADQVCARVLAFAATEEGQRVLRQGDPPDIERIKAWVEYARQAQAA